MATFLIKNFMAKAVFAFILGITHIWAFVQMFVLKGTGDLSPYMVVPVFMAVIAVLAIAAGVYFIPEYFREKKHNEEIRKSL